VATMTDEQRGLLKAALEENRVGTLCRVVSEVARRRMDGGYRDGRMLELLTMSPRNRAAKFSEASRASALLREIGDAAVSRKYSEIDIVAVVEGLYSFGDLDDEMIARISESARK